MTTLLEFAYDTGDTCCNYLQEFVIVLSEDPINIAMIEDLIASYLKDGERQMSGYDGMTERIMKSCEYSWWFLDEREVSINRTHTFWI